MHKGGQGFAVVHPTQERKAAGWKRRRFCAGSRTPRLTHSDIGGRTPPYGEHMQVS